MIETPGSLVIPAESRMAVRRFGLPVMLHGDLARFAAQIFGKS